MQKIIRYVCLAFLLLSAESALSQVEVMEDLIPDPELHISRQHSFFGHVHSGGFGLGFRWGNIRSIERYTFQEVEFLQLRHPKAERRSGFSFVGSPRRFIFGGINQLYALRYGFGTQRTLSEKPYWGGIQVDYTISIGGVLGLAIPQYLGILYLRDPVPPFGENPWEVRFQRFDPDNDAHMGAGPGLINGMGPMFRGLFNLRPYPGIYARFAFNFDFGRYQERVSALEVGVMVDVFPIPVPMMAIQNPNPVPDPIPDDWRTFVPDRNFFFLNFYIAYHFGRRR
ncbi:MAG: hypothetical protein FWC94_02115 [Bacteroidales bacterium]|nr:hypothetical protein [Bacteroidales bacterium]